MVRWTQYVCVCVFSAPVLHALVHVTVVDTLFLHAAAASSQTVDCLLVVFVLHPVHTHTHRDQSHVVQICYISEVCGSWFLKVLWRPPGEGKQ